MSKEPKEDLVKEARELLSEVTPWPWEVVAADDYFVEAPGVIVEPPKYVDANLARPAICKTVVEVSNQTKDCGEGNANLIARAPALISAFCDEVDRLNALNSTQQESIRHFQREQKETHTLIRKYLLLDPEDQIQDWTTTYKQLSDLVGIVEPGSESE